MPRGDPSAAHRRRDELARAEGYRNYYDKRSAIARRRGYPGGYAQQRRARAAGELTPTDTTYRRATTRQVHDIGGGVRIVTTTPGGAGWAVIERQLARTPGEPVRAVVHWIDAAGDDHEAQLWQHGSSAGWVLDGAREQGWHAFITDQLEASAGDGRGSTGSDKARTQALETPPVAITWAGFTIGGGWRKVAA